MRILLFSWLGSCTNYVITFGDTPLYYCDHLQEASLATSSTNLYDSLQRSKSTPSSPLLTASLPGYIISITLSDILSEQTLRGGVCNTNYVRTDIVCGVKCGHCVGVCVPHAPNAPHCVDKAIFGVEAGWLGGPGPYLAADIMGWPQDKHWVVEWMEGINILDSPR